MAGREILQRPLDADGHVVTGLPTAVNASDAVPLSQMQTADTVVLAAIPALSSTPPADVTKAAAAAGTGTASARADHKHDVSTAAPIATGTANTEGTSTALARSDHVHQTSFAGVAAALATASSDLAFNGHKLTAIADGVNPQDALAFHQLGDAVSAAAYSVTNAAALVGVNAGDGALRYVQTYRDLWRLDKSGTARTVVAHQVLQSTVNAAWYWIRLNLSDPFWQAQANWYIDPEGTNSTPGNDEADGLTSSTPFTSIAEWRRRIGGARFGASPPTIHVLSGSTLVDDGMFHGFTTEQQTGFVKVMATPTVIGTGTVTGYTPYIGNARGILTDSAIPVSWTASGYVTTTSGSRFIRKAGAGARHYAPVLLDLGSKSAQIGITNDLDETSFPIKPNIAETNFAIGDAYEIVSLPRWPMLQPGPLVNVGVSCVDISRAIPTPLTGIGRMQLCGLTDPFTFGYPAEGGGPYAYNCVICAAGSQSGIQVSGCLWFFANCSFVNSGFVATLGGSDLNVNGEANLFINSTMTFHTGARVSLGNMRFYDCTSALITVMLGSGVNLTHPVVGSGNSGPLISALNAGIVTGASQMTATTSLSNPYVVSGVNYATPIVDGGSGDAIYN